MPPAQPPKNDTVVLTLSVAELEKMIADGVSQGIKNAFTVMGIDAMEPLEAQKDFAFLRDMRKGTKSMTSKVFLALIVAAAVAIAGWTWYGYVNAVNPTGHTGSH